MPSLRLTARPGRRFLLAVLLVARASPVHAQQAVDAAPFPTPWSPSASVARLSHDGSRIHMRSGAAFERPRTVVVDASSGAMLFDGRTLEGDGMAIASSAMSPDGAWLAYVLDDTLARTSTLAVRDLASGADRVVLVSDDDIDDTLIVEGVADDGVTVAFSVLRYQRWLVGLASIEGVAWVFSNCPTQSGRRPAVLLSGDGQRLITASVLSSSGTTDPVPVAGVFYRQFGQFTCVPLPGALPGGSSVTTAHDGSWIAYSPAFDRSASPPPGLTRGAPVLVDLTTGAVTGIAPPSLGGFMGISADGRFALFAADGSDARLFDRRTGLVTRLEVPLLSPTNDLSARLSGNGAVVAVRRDSGLLRYPRADHFVARLDVDADGLHDAWERAFGLDATDPADADRDADGDGLSSRSEYARGTHPHGTPIRYFAEGAHGTFFATSLALFNPGDRALTVNVRFLGPWGGVASRPVPLPAWGPAYVDLDEVALPFAEFSIVVESPTPIVAERRMTWDRATGYGSHASSGVEAPSATWHFAEGATSSGMQTFFLLQNPGAVPAAVTMRYLLTDGTIVERAHVVPVESRVTVWANREGSPMDAAEFATTVDSDQPIVAERAMYRDVGTQVYGAGSATSGVPAPLTEWSFAEGATGDFFDTYLLLANPSDQPVDTTVRFETDVDPNDLGPTLSPVIRTYSLAPHARRTLRVADQDPKLTARQVSLLITSSAPIVAERAMWWPGPTATTWAECHADTGAGPTGVAWAVADLQSDTAPEGWDTFLLVNAPQSTGPLVRVRLACEDGTTVDRTLALLPYRATLWMRYEFPESVGRRCAATLESLPRKLTNSPTVQPNRAPMRIEKAMYSGGFSAGTASSATRLPDLVDPPP